MATERPVRRMDPYAEQFWQFTKNREFRLQQCVECSKFRWPPAPMCDACLSEAYEWAPVTGQGNILSWVTFRRAYFPEYPVPHHVIVVELDEGPLFVSNPVEMDAGELKAGMRMALRWVDAQDRFGEYNLPVFARA
jgi:uncharacterized OB-fold protein